MLLGSRLTQEKSEKSVKMENSYFLRKHEVIDMKKSSFVKAPVQVEEIPRGEFLVHKKRTKERTTGTSEEKHTKSTLTEMEKVEIERRNQICKDLLSNSRLIGLFQKNLKTPRNINECLDRIQTYSAKLELK
jgi:hypothetical protein